MFYGLYNQKDGLVKLGRDKLVFEHKTEADKEAYYHDDVKVVELSECCAAFAKGTDDGVCCRACYGDFH